MAKNKTKISSEEFIVWLSTIALVVGLVGNSQFMMKYFELVSAIFIVVMIFGLFSTAVALVLRRVRIYRDKNIYGDKAEEFAPSIKDTMNRIVKTCVGVFLFFAIVSFFATLQKFA